MGCTGSTHVQPEKSKRPLEMTKECEMNEDELPTPITFVVPLHEDDDSLIKKHPPKRFQKLEEQQTSPPPITRKMLQDKLAEAEQRRIQILNERIESAKHFMKPRSGNGVAASQPIHVEG